MKALVRGSALLLCIVLGTALAEAQTPEEIVEKHLAAMGGRQALAKLQTRVTTGTVTVSTQGMNFSGPVEIDLKAPNKARSLIRLDLSSAGAGEVVVEQRCDGKTAYASNSMQGDRDITGSQLQSMVNSRFPTPLLDYKEAGAKLELVGKDKIGDRAVLTVKYTPKVGPTTTLFFDAETFLLVRNVTKFDVPEAGGEMEQTSDLGDYRDVDGVKVPFMVTNTNALQTATIAITKVEHNKPIDDAMFARPVK